VGTVEQQCSSRLECTCTSIFGEICEKRDLGELSLTGAAPEERDWIKLRSVNVVCYSQGSARTLCLNLGCHADHVDMCLGPKYFYISW
jgi:hypothetical protein